MNATRLKEDVKFKALWGEEMKIKKGGYLLQDPRNKSDIYGISKEDFRGTYKFNNKPSILDKLKEKGRIKPALATRKSQYQKVDMAMNS